MYKSKWIILFSIVLLILSLVVPIFADKLVVDYTSFAVFLTSFSLILLYISLIGFITGAMLWAVSAEMEKPNLIAVISIILFISSIVGYILAISSSFGGGSALDTIILLFLSYALILISFLGFIYSTIFARGILRIISIILGILILILTFGFLI